MPVLLALFVLLAACEGPRETAAHAAATTSASQLRGFSFAGCSVIDRGERCELGADGKLTFWLPDPQALAAVRGDGKLLRFERVMRVEEGRRYELKLPPGTRQLELAAASGGRATLQLVPALTAPVLERARGLREQGKFGEARAQLTAALPGLPETLQWRAKAQLARLSLAQSDPEAAVEGLTASMRAAYAAGRISEGTLDATALAYVLTTSLRSYARAREVLKTAWQYAGLDPAGAALLPHYEGVLAIETGDLQRALGQFRESVRRTARLGMREHELLAREQEAGALASLGRYDEAVASQRRIVDEFPSPDACQRADRKEGVVWFGLLAEPAPGSALSNVIADYAQRSARELAECPSRWRARNHEINQALAALQHGDLTRAGTLLESLSKPVELRDPLLDTWVHELRGRHALQGGRARDALVQFRAALALSERAGLWDNRQLAQLGIARALAALGQLPAAITAYEQAEHSLNSSLASVPLSEGQAGFRRAREAGTQEWIRLLLRTGQTERAFAVARGARARRSAALAASERAHTLPADARERWEAALARYHERRELAERAANDAWQLPADQLPEHQRLLARRRQEAHAALDEAYATIRGTRAEPKLTPAEPGELVVGLFPDAAHLRVFVQAGGRTRSHEVPMFDAAQVPADLLEQILGRYARELGEFARLRAIVHPSLGWLDLHALSFHGAPLLERFSLRYGTDTPPPAIPAAAQSGTLIVIDPRGDLRAAEAERKLVAPVDSGPVQTLYGPEARRSELLSHLPQRALLHYAGHHRFAGIEGTDSALLLADGELSVGDVLTLSRGPARVVLATCEGARHEGPGWSGGLGMAQAFIAIGAEEVVAASRPVPDQAAREVTAALYAALRAEPKLALSEALRRAQLQLHARAQNIDWPAFRALGR